MSWEVDSAIDRTRSAPDVLTSMESTISSAELHTDTINDGGPSCVGHVHCSNTPSPSLQANTNYIENHMVSIF